MLSRNKKTKGFKIKQGIKIITLIAVGIWLLYQLKHSHDKKPNEESSAKIFEKLKPGHETKKLGRKGFQPWKNKPYELMEESELERVMGQSSGGDDDDDIVGHDRNRVEDEEPEEVEDLIDEEDKEKEEENEEMEEAMSLLEDQGHNEDEKDTQETGEKHYKETKS
ncbi:hypothetical protein SESBI_22413 [Sesbania bispinosa]|nr:hypothetical protein SESBI_22413 [Sesbania bispinosa]